MLNVIFVRVDLRNLGMVDGNMRVYRVEGAGRDDIVRFL
jgi:hypothetical protein